MAIGISFSPGEVPHEFYESSFDDSAWGTLPGKYHIISDAHLKTLQNVVCSI